MQKHKRVFNRRQLMTGSARLLLVIVSHRFTSTAKSLSAQGSLGGYGRGGYGQKGYGQSYQSYAPLIYSGGD